jgi:hypothetical protein
MDSSGSWYGFDHGNALLDYINRRKFLVNLSDSQLPRKGSAPRN